MSGTPSAAARSIAARSSQSSTTSSSARPKSTLVDGLGAELVHDHREPPLEVADRLGASIEVAGSDLAAVQPLRGLDLEGRRRRGRESARRFGLRRRPLAAIDLLHQEPLLLRRALLVPALPLAAEVHVELLATVCERDAVADALLRRATLERAASRTRHQPQLMLGAVCFIGSDIRSRVSRTVKDPPSNRERARIHTSALTGWTCLESGARRAQPRVEAVRGAAARVRCALAGRPPCLPPMPREPARRRSATERVDHCPGAPHRAVRRSRRRGSSLGRCSSRAFRAVSRPGACAAPPQAARQ